MKSDSPGSFTPSGIDHFCINTIRFLSTDAVQKANSGHPGMPMGAAPTAYILWSCFLKHNPANPAWFNRDRFVLSAGYASMLLYSLLHLTAMTCHWMRSNNSGNGNIIWLGSLVVDYALAWKFLQTFINASFIGADRHCRRLAKITAL